jgi:hypothetical protein
LFAESPGISTSQALTVAVAVGAIGVLSGGAVFVAAVGWRAAAFFASYATSR